MMQYLFRGIPSLLFEPVAVTALCGLVFAFFRYFKKHDRFFWSAVFAIVFMLGWRLFCHSIMLSTRYASILLYPAIISSVWLCFFLANILKYIFSHRLPDNPAAGKVFSVLPFFFVVVLAVACTCKTLRRNPYGDHTVELCKILKKEISGKDFTIFSTIERERIAYYSGTDVNRILAFGDTVQALKNKIVESRNCFKNLYFIFYLKKGEPEPDADHLKLNPEDGEWKCLYQGYTSRRKDKKIVLYRFIPAHPDIEIRENPIPPLSRENLCVNGDFERLLEGKSLKDRIAYYKKIQASDFYTTQERKFPVAWWFGVGKAGKGFSNMAVTDQHPIAGKYSLEMDSSRGREWWMNSGSIPKQNCIFSGFLRAESDAHVWLHSCYWDADKKRTCYIHSYYFSLNAGNLYRFSFPVHVKDIPRKDKSIFLIVHGSGHVLMDNVEFIRTQKKSGMK